LGKNRDLLRRRSAQRTRETFTGMLCGTVFPQSVDTAKGHPKE
jgi:hypothetical protein